MNPYLCGEFITYDGGAGQGPLAMVSGGAGFSRVQTMPDIAEGIRLNWGEEGINCSNIDFYLGLFESSYFNGAYWANGSTIEYPSEGSFTIEWPETGTYTWLHEVGEPIVLWPDHIYWGIGIAMRGVTLAGEIIEFGTIAISSGLNNTAPFCTGNGLSVTTERIFENGIDPSYFPLQMSDYQYVEFYVTSYPNDAPGWYADTEGGQWFDCGEQPSGGGPYSFIVSSIHGGLPFQGSISYGYGTKITATGFNTYQDFKCCATAPYGCCGGGGSNKYAPGFLIPRPETPATGEENVSVPPLESALLLSNHTFQFPANFGVTKK